jgi:hypothetical protein
MMVESDSDPPNTKHYTKLLVAGGWQQIAPSISLSVTVHLHLPFCE